MAVIDFLGKSLVLASQSPRRSEILKMAGIEFTVFPSDYEEDNKHKISPSELVKNHAYYKALYVAPEFSNAWILGADTLVVIGDKVLGKPKNAEEAVSMLQKLSGKKHTVHTGFSIINTDSKKSLTCCESTDVYFRELSLPEISHYVDNYQPFDKAGSYAIQDFSAIFVEKIDGCFYNVVGFPITRFISVINSELKDCL